MGYSGCLERRAVITNSLVRWKNSSLHFVLRPDRPRKRQRHVHVRLASICWNDSRLPCLMYVHLSCPKNTFTGFLSCAVNYNLNSCLLLDAPTYVYRSEPQCWPQDACQKWDLGTWFSFEAVSGRYLLLTRRCAPPLLWNNLSIGNNAYAFAIYKSLDWGDPRGLSSFIFVVINLWKVVCSASIFPQPCPLNS
jgi:hypothetical protein